MNKNNPKAITEMESFCHWYTENKELTDKGVYNIKVNSAILQLDQERFYKTLSYKNVFEEFNANSESKISETCYDKHFIAQLKKVGEIFSDDLIPIKDNVVNNFVSMIKRENRSITDDALFISAFVHDLKTHKNGQYSDCEIEFSKECLQLCNQITPISNIQKIIEIIKDIISNLRFETSSGELKELLFHLIPLIVFVMLNILINECADCKSIYDQKPIKYIISASKNTFLCNSNDSIFNQLIIKDFDDIQKCFLYNLIDFLSGYFFKNKKAFTTRHFPRERYLDYNNINMIILDDNLKNNSYVEFGNYSDYKWIFRLISSKIYGKNISSIKMLELFKSILSSCNVTIIDEYSGKHIPFLFNKTANLFVFNNLTKLIDALILSEEPEYYQIYLIEGFKTKISLMNYYDQKDLFRYVKHIFNYVTKSLCSNFISYQNPINYDPFEEYMRFIYDVNPKPKRDSTY